MKRTNVNYKRAVQSEVMAKYLVSVISSLRLTHMLSVGCHYIAH